MNYEKMKHKKKIVAASLIGLLGTAEVVIGDLDWHWVSKDPRAQVKEAAESVVRVDIKGLGRCTATTIGEDIILTNFHCLQNGEFKYKVTGDYIDTIVHDDDRRYVSCNGVITSNERLDYAIGFCPGLNLPAATINVDPVQKDQEIVLIHQNCDYKLGEDAPEEDPNRASWCKPYKVVSDGKFLSASTGNHVTHNADTLGGSSGSAIFDADLTIRALHNSGYSNGRGTGRGDRNGGINARKIVANLTPDVREQLNIIGDMSTLQDTFNTNPASTYTPTATTRVTKRSFKCRYFWWLSKKVRKKCGR